MTSEHTGFSSGANGGDQRSRNQPLGSAMPGETGYVTAQEVRVRAVRFDDYGDSSALRVDEVPEPVPAAGQVVVQVKATGINPADAKIRGGIMRSYSPLTFPASQGSDLAGVV